MGFRQARSSQVWLALVLTSVLGLGAVMSMPDLFAQGQGAGPSVQQPVPRPRQFVLRSQTNLVLVDVRVWNRSGRPEADLKQNDFRVFEDGVPQKIVSFSFENIERLALATESGAAPPTIDLGKAPSEVPLRTLVQDHRLIVLFFDLSSMPVDDLMRALNASTDFARKQMTPADLVAVVTYTSSLRVIQDFTNDRDSLDRVLRGIRVGESASLSEAGAQGEPGTTGSTGQEVVAQDVSAAFMPDETEFNIFNTDQKLAAVESLARMLRDIPGRKSVIQFTSGLERTGIENQAQLRAAVDAANQANVSLYAVDARGLVALAPGGSASAASPAGTAVYTGQAVFSQFSSLQGARETLATLATDTGGRLFYDLNDFTPAFQQVQAENTSYYLLAYTPSNTRSDGHFRRIRVEVSIPGLKVEARPGYFAPKGFRQFTREDKELQLQQAMDFDTPFLDLPFVVEADYFRQADQKFYVVLAAKIPGSAISFLKKSGRLQAEFDFAWRATDQSGRPAAALRDTLPVKLSGEAYEQIQSSNILYQGGFVLPAGKHRLKVVVRENESGKLGTFEQSLTLPEVGDKRMDLSSVVLSNELKETAENSGRRARRVKEGREGPLQLESRSVLPSVTRVFRTDQNLYIYLESYIGKSMPRRDAAQGISLPPPPPSIALAFFRGGVKVAEAGPFPGKREKSSGDRARYFAQIPLEKFSPGRYSVQINVLDPSRDCVAFARVPMAIIRQHKGSTLAGGAR